MIKNIVFDMGNVLRTFDPILCISPYTEEEEDIELICSILFGHMWAELDRGTTTYDEVLAYCRGELPKRLHSVLETILARWHLHMPVDERMTEVVRKLKENGYGLYLLSNASVRFAEYQKETEVFSYFDGFVVSAFYKTVKPEPEIYRILFKLFKLNPSECFFIDDSPQNVAGGEATGMSGYTFDGDIDRMLARLAETGVVC